MIGDQSFLRIYFPFAAGYFLSYVFRTVNAVISPELTRELALGPTALGLLTSAYFVAFAATQIPAGMLLDRFGPRRVEPVLLLIAGTGALIFGLAHDETTLLFARALVGVGVATCLMAPLKGIAMWFPSERRSSLSGWMMVAGGTGALVATVPLEIALRHADWRTLFFGLALATYLVAIWIAWRVPDVVTLGERPGWRQQWLGVRSVFSHPRFWWIAPIGGFGMGAFMAIQGLWSIPWLMEVEGYDRAVAARYLLVMSVITLAGYFAIGAGSAELAQRGLQPRHVFASGFALNMLGLAGIVFRLPGDLGWWTLYGLGASVNILGFNVLADGFARELAGRVTTGLNLLMFLASFVTQWGIGLVVDGVRLGFGLSIAEGLRVAFGIVLLLQVVAYLWFALRWRQHATAPPLSSLVQV